MATVTGMNAGPYADRGEAGGYRQQEEEETRCSLFCYAKPAVEKPCATCSCFCCALVFFILLIVILLGAGVEVIRFTSEVPFYLYNSDVYKKETALTSAFDVANARLDGELREREQAESDFKLQIIYESDDGNSLLTPEKLAAIKGLEEKIVAVEDYLTFCALNYEFDEANPICVRHASAVNFFDPDWWVPAFTSPDFPTVPSAANAELVMNQSTIAGPSREQYYVFADPQDIGATDTVDLDDANVDTLVEYWAGYCSDAAECPDFANGDVSPYAMTVQGTNVTVSNQLVPLVDTDFSIQDDSIETNAMALQSVFYFGAPQFDEDELELYEMDTDGFEDQRSNLGDFLIDNVVDVLEDGLDGINVFWEGSSNGMLSVYADEVLTSDASLLIFSVIFIVVYLIFQLKSWWLGAVGILMILGNFGPALIVYRVLSGYSYFGTLNALSIFLVLGIGADDIFVFMNTWKHVRRTQGHLHPVQQLQEALKTGGKAMLVTSVTTAVSFLINATSGFPAVQSFGIFSALLILTNFCAVITLYPAAVMVYEYYMFQPEKRKNFCAATCHCCKKDKGIVEAQAGEEGVNAGDTLVRFFKDKFYPFLHKFRFGLLLIFVGIMALYIAVGSDLVPDTESPQLLPDTDQYIQVTDKITEYFSHSDSSALVTVEIPFGIEGADRDDCDGDPCDPTVGTDYGAPIWDTDIGEIENEYAQKWFLDFCEDLQSGSDDLGDLRIYEPDESNPVPVGCPFQFFKTWCEQGVGRCPQTHPTLDPDEYVIDAVNFTSVVVDFLEDDIPITSDAVFSSGLTNYDVWEEQIRFESNASSGSVILRYVSIQVLLDMRFDVEYETGIDLYHDWEEYVEGWVSRAGGDDYPEAEPVVDSAFVTDGGAFHWFFLQETIITEALRGIGLSLFCAFIIMCLATCNWWISLMAIFTIAAMVGGVVFFTVINDWKLGVLEAILFVMVVGFSVDYTMHLSDSYLESEKASRGDRTRDMLATMGPSVLSGAISTIGACFPLLFAYFVFFLKFGTVIFFIIIQSLIFSLLFYSAMLDTMGPEQPVFGLRIKKGVHVAIKDGGSNRAQGENKDNPEHLSFGKVISVDGDNVTIALEHRAGETTAPISHCRQRYEFGHLVFIESCTESLVDFVTERLGKRNGSKAQVGAKTGEGGNAI